MDRGCQSKGIDLIGSGSNVVVVLIVRLEVETLTKRQVRAELICRLVPASSVATVVNLTLRVG
jgi:hypothetical protein